ncbi:D-arabinono-1,4-lactone oxidase [Physcia stellaris]|nr:D-arabinono-1,4-lactone oxidase [Physcia stellaris]
MDPRLKQELHKVDPATPFRATTSHIHHTWAKTYFSRPELYIQPHTTDEIQKIITLARRCRRRLVTVGCSHSPSDLTCTSSWMVNLDHYNKILHLDKTSKVVVMQAGIRLHDLGRQIREHGLALPNLGSIDHQSMAGALGTATHGSSTRHGILAQSVLGLKIMLANGRVVSCSREQNLDLFRAALVSLGALGVITEVTYQMTDSFKIEWSQSLHPLDEILADWEKGLWTDNEFTRVWWMPYMKRVIKWTANKTELKESPPEENWWTGMLGFHVYHFCLYVSQWVPRILPALEKFVTNVQYGFKDGVGGAAVQDGHNGLLMNCLYSQFVNEWAIPLERGPEALTRLSAWLNRDDETARIPVSSKGIYVHAPIEVRVTDTSKTQPRPYLDNTVPDGPTLYLNATLYRPYGRDPPCRERYYQAFEYLMKELGGRPHWAKNFLTVTKDEFHSMYPEMGDWLRVRKEVDPDGMFPAVGGRKRMTTDISTGGQNWSGQMPVKGLSPQTSEESFDIMHGAEAEKSILFQGSGDAEEEEEEEL